VPTDRFSHNMIQKKGSIISTKRASESASETGCICRPLIYGPKFSKQEERENG